MFLTLLLDFLKGCWNFFKKHWYGCITLAIIIVLSLTLHFKNNTITKQTKTIKNDVTVIKQWQDSNTKLNADITAQNQAVTKLQQQTQDYKDQVAAAAKVAATISANYNQQYRWLLQHPAPSTCTGAMDYLLKGAINSQGVQK